MKKAKPEKKKFAISRKAVALLRRVQRHILAEPRRYDQNTWFDHSHNSPCGTAACIAGWTVILGHRKRITQTFLNSLWASGGSLYGSKLSVQSVPDEARRLLGLPEGIIYGASLFTGSPEGSWPEPFAERWNNADTEEEFAQIASDRIDYFIQTGK